jgi:hypothetical protein
VQKYKKKSEIPNLFEKKRDEPSDLPLFSGEKNKAPSFTLEL